LAPNPTQNTTNKIMINNNVRSRAGSKLNWRKIEVFLRSVSRPSPFHRVSLMPFPAAAQYQL
jgi:hypothetical protein